MRTQCMLACIMLIGLGSGCTGRLIGEGVAVATGPKGDYFEENAVAPEKDDLALRDYSRFELGEVRNVYGKHVPTEFMGKFREEFPKRMKGFKPVPSAAGKTLVVRVDIIHYEKADVTDNVFGPLEQVVAHVELVDKESGNILATGNAIGRTGKTVGLGAGAKAEGLAKGIAKWISAYYPDSAEEDAEKKDRDSKDRGKEDGEEPSEEKADQSA